MSQLEHFIGHRPMIYALVALTLLVIYIFPYISKAVPSTLVAIIIVTALAVVMNIQAWTVGDMGTIPRTLPEFLIPAVPFNLETLMIILPYSVALAVVGLIESLLTASIVDDMTNSDSEKNVESRGQGIANITVGLFGGMASCAMIGQSVINVKSGGRGRLSAFVAGAFLMFLIVVLGDIVVLIPMAVLAGVMIMVSISTFDWNSLRTLHLVPKTDATVMLVTVITVVVTHNLAIGVFAGILLSGIFFAAKISDIKVDSKTEGSKKVYKIRGQLFFASVTDLLKKFEYQDDVKEVEINLARAHIWDDSAVVAIDKIVHKFKENGIEAHVTGLNEESSELVDKLANRLGGH